MQFVAGVLITGMKMTNEPILKIENISKTFQRKTVKGVQVTNALKDISFNLQKGEVLGLVGESGSGKTTIGKVIVGLLSPDSGEIWYMGKPISNLSVRQFRPFRKSIQMIFQNPYASLNPSMPVHRILEEPLKMRNHGKGDTGTLIKDLIKKVNLNEVKLQQLPKHLSGGERRRVGLARILAVEPEVIILDEPVAALDQSIKEQVIRLLVELQKEQNLTFLWISHDLLTIEYVAHRIAIMYQGIIVEILNRNDLNHLIHPYSKEIFAASKFMANQYDNVAGRTFYKILSEEKYLENGCPYRNRCEIYKENHSPAICKSDTPQLKQIDDTHQIACHLLRSYK